MTKLEELRAELRSLRIYHTDLWGMYGSELCAGEMIAKERELEKQIEVLEQDERNNGTNKN